jgi:hypothetical protein
MRPQPPPMALFKIVAVALVAINVIWHGIVALFLGGPPGFGVFLVGVFALWGWAWVTVRRSHAASAEERPDPIQPDEAEVHDPDSVGTGAG